MLGKISLLILIIVVVSFQQQYQLSQCIGNCMFCDPKDPSTCIDLNYTFLNQNDCLPFYKGENCQQQSYGYENVVHQNGTFSNWISNKTTSCQLMINSGKGVWVQSQRNNYKALGSVGGSETLSRSLKFADEEVMNRVVIKFSVAVEGANIEIYFTTLSTTKQWITVTLIGLTTTSQTISAMNLSMSNLSSVRTTCGYVYTYQLTVDLNKQYSEFQVNFSANNNGGLNLTWSLLSFDFSLGCRGLLASSGNSGSYNCDSCLSGYYPKYAVNNQVDVCKACDYRCKACVNLTTCLTCEQNAKLDERTAMCEFSQFFITLEGYQIITGNLLDLGNLLESQVVKSKEGLIQLSVSLSNNQPFTVSLLLLYSSAFVNSRQTLTLLINNQSLEMNTTDLPLDVPITINGMSDSSSIIYQTKLRFNGTATRVVFNFSNTTNLANSTNVTNITNETINTSSPLLFGVEEIFQNASITLKAVTASGDQFGVAGVNVVQFQCAKNCYSCTYSPQTQTSQCTKCKYFFDLATNCLTCANGYYLATTNSIDQCVKCYSTCKHCIGPEISDCLSCFDSFQLSTITYDYQCITCIYRSQFQSINAIAQCTNSPYCTINNPLSSVITNTNCRQCLNAGEDQLTNLTVCLNCWLAQGLAKGACEPVPKSGLQLYGSDVSDGLVSDQWTSNMDLIEKNITQLYNGLYGVDWQRQGDQQTTLTFIQPFLPSHRGLTIFFTLFKVNYWTGTSSDQINVVIRSQDQYIVINSTINVNPYHGYNIYGDLNSGPQMMYTFVGSNLQHSYTGKLQLIITASHTGIFLQNMEVYLGNCKDCNGNRLVYEIQYIPTTSVTDTQTGIDVWLTFNQGVSFVSNDLETEKKIINSFQFSIDQLGYQNLIPFTIVDNQLRTWNFVKYFLPIQGTLVNATLRVNNSMENSIYSTISTSQSILGNPFAPPASRKETNTRTPRLLLNSRLSSTNVQETIHRYEDLSGDERTSMSQLDSFYEFFQWFGLISMIIFAFLGIGIIFQQFSILLQLLFIHIYISTNLLPATFKQPLSQMYKMQNLNYFAYSHAQQLQQSWFTNVNQSAPYPFTQYHVDVYFARLFYPTIIINLIYLVWFVILLLCWRFVRVFRNSQNKIIKFLRDIPQRPLNYIDQIWRYQFITTMWASFIQFSSFDGHTAEMRFNLVICIFSFIISLVWPIFVMIYTYRQHLVINVQHFMYLYNDIYYRRTSSIADKTRYYVYIGVRFGRYFSYALFIAVFIYQSIIGPVFLLTITFLQIIYILRFKIFRDSNYLLFKLIENIGFIILEILLLIVYGFADGNITNEGYVSVGYGVGVLCILMIVNGLVRVFYLGYKKMREVWKGMYDYGERGEMEDFDNKKQIDIELPTTQRGLY